MFDRMSNPEKCVWSSQLNYVLTVLVDFILVLETFFTNIRPVYAVYDVLR